ncbi:MAG: TetR/AcrR family transcriptional regulator [Candidatus Gastranaerophilales bacterium]|nr:TetR/AcrR family transcriptional regulator [Candidatus Gastranaerophilales bacterium]
MARPKKQINRRTDILDAAQNLFTINGFEKTTIDEIAKYSGIGKGSVYLDFKNKDEILLAVAERHVILLVEQLELQLKNARAPYLEFLKHIYQYHVITVFDMALSHTQNHIVLIHTSYQVKQKLSHLLERWLINIACILEKAEKNREIKYFDDYKKLASLIQISLQGFYPPYNIKYSTGCRTDLTKEELRSLLLADASTVIGIILSGLKNVNNKIKEYNNEAKID